jgi:hypothetical protein
MEHLARRFGCVHGNSDLGRSWWRGMKRDVDCEYDRQNGEHTG